MTKTPQPPKRRRWSRSFRIRLALALLLLAGLGAWRYGWPPRSWETTVCPLEEIGWLEAARLVPSCVRGRNPVAFVEGELDESGNPVLDLKWMKTLDDGIRSVYEESLLNLQLPDLAGKQFRVGAYWVDLPDDVPDPAAGYGLLLMCDQSQRWEEAAELIVDINRNRDLTDDPVMAISDVWSHERENPYADFTGFTRVFEPIKLSRAASEEDGVEALPVLDVSYYGSGKTLNYVILKFGSTSFRRGQLVDKGGARDIVIAPDETRLGRFDGPRPTCWRIEGIPNIGRNLTAWNFERDAFWGGTLDADGRELRNGPYKGPTGVLQAETAGGEPLQIEGLGLWLRGKAPHWIQSEGWAPVPRLSSFTWAVDEHPLPVGEYGIGYLLLASNENYRISIETDGRWGKLSPQEFSIQDDQTTLLRLPKTLEFEAVAYIESRPRPAYIERVWSSDEDPPEDDSSEWKGPRPDSEVTFSVSISDPATDNQYSIYPSSGDPSDGIQLVIQDEAGETVHQGTLEYG